MNQVLKYNQVGKCFSQICFHKDFEIGYHPPNFALKCTYLYGKYCTFERNSTKH